MQTILHADQVSYRVGDATLLRNTTIELRAGTVHTLVGPNGAGKSTLLTLLAGDAAPTMGEVYFAGKRLPDYSKKQLALKRAVMPQDVVLSFAFQSEEVVMMGRYPHRAARKGNEKQHRAVVEKSMERTQSTPLRHRYYPTLSGGEQARVTLARVLAQEASVLLLDEPTASLDPRHQHLVMRLARRHADRGGAVLAVLHDLNLAAAYSDHIALMSEGTIRADGPPEKVLRPSLLEAVFQTPFYVAEHPSLALPLVLSLPGGAGVSRVPGVPRGRGGRGGAGGRGGRDRSGGAGGRGGTGGSSRRGGSGGR